MVEKGLVFRPQMDADVFLNQRGPKAGRVLSLHHYSIRHLREGGDPGIGSFKGTASCYHLCRQTETPDFGKIPPHKFVGMTSFTVYTKPSLCHPETREAGEGSLRIATGRIDVKGVYKTR